tara:strand:- start:23104 stop:24033 length:930 start_codon:yes stop_codon:yes gene_type:complete
MDSLIQAIFEKKFKEAKYALDERISDVVSRKLFEVKKSILAKISEAEILEYQTVGRRMSTNVIDNRNKIGPDIGQKSVMQGAISKPVSSSLQKPLPPSDPKLDWIKKKVQEETRAEKYADKKAEWEAKEKPYKKQKMTDKRLEDLKAKLGITTRKFDADMHSKVAKIGQHARGSLEESTDYMKRRKSMDAMPKLVRPKPTKVDAAKTDYMKRRKAMSEEELQEASFKIVRARVRGGKIQRRKKVSTRPGYTFRGGKLVRMSPSERRKRKMGARRGKIKRRSKMNRANMKRARSNRKRNALGLNRKPGKR